MVQEIDVGEALDDPKREAFARLVASGEAHYVAYKEAGYCPNGSPRTAQINAARLMARPEVKARVKQLSESASTARMLSTARRREILARIAAHEKGWEIAPSYSERIAAAREDAILAGERRTDGTQVTFAQINVGTMLAGIHTATETPLGAPKPVHELEPSQQAEGPQNGPLAQ